MFKDIKQVMKDSVLYGIGNVAVKLVGFILIPLYTDAEYFSTADYGLMGLLEVTSQILIAVMGLSLYSGLIRWYWDAEYRDKQKTIFFTTLLFTILTSLCIGSVLWLNVTAGRVFFGRGTSIYSSITDIDFYVGGSC